MDTNKVYSEEPHEEDGKYCCVECALMNTYTYCDLFRRLFELNVDMSHYFDQVDKNNDTKDPEIIKLKSIYKCIKQYLEDQVTY